MEWLSDDERFSAIKENLKYITEDIADAAVKSGKNPEDVKVRFGFCFPDVYEIGMSHLGIQILYGMLNQWDDVWCERVYSPWVDLDKIMREKNIPLFEFERVNF